MVADRGQQGRVAEQSPELAGGVAEELVPGGLGAVLNEIPRHQHQIRLAAFDDGQVGCQTLRFCEGIAQP